MHPDLDKSLVRDFPNLYAQRNLDCMQTCMCWGFECGDGWEPIIRQLSETITKLSPEVQATQVKEKYGGLRFYTDTSTPEVDQAISDAENLSDKTCEECGEPGRHWGVGWIVTRCKKHWDEYQKDRYR